VSVGGACLILALLLPAFPPGVPVDLPTPVVFKAGPYGRPVVEAHTHADSPLVRAMDVVGECESGNDYTAENTVSSASGRYQFIDSTWLWVTGLEPPASDYPPAIQDDAFTDLWGGGAGAKHWVASRSCWGARL